MAVTQVIKTLGNVLEGMKTIIDSWLSTNITNPSSPPLDRSLSLTNAAAPADLVGDLKTNIDRIDDKAPVIVESVSGDVVSFDDGAEDMPLKKCLIQIEPVQDLHGQDSPYPAGGGKNKYSGTSVNLGGTNPRTQNEYVSTIPAGIYYFSCTKTGTATSGGVQLIDSNNNVIAQLNASEITGKAVTLSADIVRLYFYMSNDEYTDGKIVSITDIQIEPGTAKTNYAPYENICPISGWTGGNITLSPTNDPDDPDKTVYPITWQTEAGTVYSGSLNVLTGVLTVDHSVKLLNGSETWSWNPNNSLVRTDVSGGIITNGTTQYNKYTLNSTFSDKSWAGRRDVDGTIGMFYGASGLFCKYSKITSALEAQAFFTSNPTTVIYELATPITYQLTPTVIKTLFQNNNIWSDIGPVSVDYCADTKTYIDNKFANG